MAIFDMKKNIDCDEWAFAYDLKYFELPVLPFWK